MTTLTIIGKNYPGYWTKMRAACRAIIIKDQDILMSYEVKNDQWMIPGGGIEEGEDARECCIREVAEETGYLVEPSECMLVIEEYYPDCKWVNQYYICKVCRETERKLTQREREAGMKPRWISIKEIKEILGNYQKYAGIDEMRRGLYQREYTALSHLI